MKATGKIKVLVAIIPVLVLAGVLLLHRAGHEKALDAPTNPNPVHDRKSEVAPAEPGKKIPSQNSSVRMNTKKLINTEDEIIEPDLPSPFNNYKLDLILTQAQAKQLWQAQDKVMSTWPVYSDVQQQLHKELLARLDIDNLSDEEIIQSVLEFRENFWQAGGCLSSTSYRDAYMARILLEYAHRRNPENMSITDELVETILSAETLWKYETNSNKKIRNSQYREVLLKLRSAQFEQIKKEVEQGRIPAWEDFIRANDLAHLLGRSEDYESAQEVTRWLIHEADRGGWNGYTEPLNKLQQALIEGSNFNYNIYIPAKSDYPQEFRYARRLPSFKGPHPEKRGVIPVHASEPNPVWLSRQEIREQYNQVK